MNFILKNFKITLILLIASFLLLTGSNAAVLYKITFDIDTQSPAPEVYPGASNDIIIPADTIISSTTLTILGNPPQFLPGDIVIAPRGAFQGGNALALNSKDSSRGYFVTSSTTLRSSFTVEAIARLTEVNPPQNRAGLQYIASREQPHSGEVDWMIRVEADGRAKANTDQEGNGAYVYSLDTISLNEWHHYAFVFTANGSASQIAFYIDGELQGTATYNLTLTNGVTFPTRWAIGFMSATQDVDPGGAGDNRGWNGEIDAIAVSDEALTPDKFVLPISLPPLVIIPESASIIVGGNRVFTASGGVAPYTWSLSSVFSTVSTVIGYISSTTGETVTFYGTNPGVQDLFCFDSSEPVKIAIARIYVVPTEAPIVPDLTLINERVKK